MVNNYQLCFYQFTSQSTKNSSTQALAASFAVFTPRFGGVGRSPTIHLNATSLLKSKIHVQMLAHGKSSNQAICSNIRCCIVLPQDMNPFPNEAFSCQSEPTHTVFYFFLFKRLNYITHMIYTLTVIRSPDHV